MRMRRRPQNLVGSGGYPRCAGPTATPDGRWFDGPMGDQQAISKGPLVFAQPPHIPAVRRTVNWTVRPDSLVTSVKLQGEYCVVSALRSACGPLPKIARAISQESPGQFFSNTACCRIFSGMNELCRDRLQGGGLNTRRLLILPQAKSLENGGAN
ncbi:hypothetical protein LZ30DRAFT_693696 [Colletotrichum cereale]|nr:hypothetical protein LZ30DRAFT_693696 [Colletotrichum cereale]